MNTNANKKKIMFELNKRELSIIKRVLSLQKEFYLNRACRLSYDGDESSSKKYQVLIKEVDLLLTKLGIDGNAIKINLKQLTEDNDYESSN